MVLLSASPGCDIALSQPKRCQTALRGRPVANSMTADCHSTSERRPRNLSVPPDRLVKTMARPPQGGRSTPGTRRGFETPVEPLSRTSGVGVVSRRLGRRAALVFDRESQSCVRTGVRRGSQSNGNGVRDSPQRGHAGSMPQFGKPPVQMRSPSSPQFGYQLPPPARCLVSVLSSSPGVFGICLRYASQ